MRIFKLDQVELSEIIENMKYDEELIDAISKILDYTKLQVIDMISPHLGRRQLNKFISLWNEIKTMEFDKFMFVGDSYYYCNPNILKILSKEPIVKIIDDPTPATYEYVLQTGDIIDWQQTYTNIITKHGHTFDDDVCLIKWPEA